MRAVRLLHAGLPYPRLDHAVSVKTQNTLTHGACVNLFLHTVHSSYVCNCNVIIHGACETLSSNSIELQGEIIYLTEQKGQFR